MDTDRPSTASGSCEKGDGFDELLADFNQELYTGCTKFTLPFFLDFAFCKSNVTVDISSLLRLIYHIKCMCY